MSFGELICVSKFVHDTIIANSVVKNRAALVSGPASVPRGLLLLLQWGGDCLAAPELVGQHHTERVDVGVVIEFEALGAWIIAVVVSTAHEVEPPVVIVKPREAVLTAQRQATVQPSQLSFHARAYEPTVALLVE